MLQHPAIMGLLAGLVTWGFTSLGAAAVFSPREFSRRSLDIMLGFAAGVMLAASFWSLLDPALELAGAGWGAWRFVPVAFGFLGGAVALRLLDILLPHLHPLEGFADVPQTKILVFYPKDGVSKVQETQMVTQEGDNVGVCAVVGNFDDAQTGVKRLFSDAALRDTPGCPERQAVRLRDGCAFGCGTSPCFCQGPSRRSRVCVTPLPGQEKEGIIILFHHSGRTARGKEKLRRSSYAVHERSHGPGP